MPDILPHPEQLIAGIRQIVHEHKDDCPEAAVTGKYVLRWTKKDAADTEDYRMKKLIPKPKRKIAKNLKNPFHKNYAKAMAHKRSLEDQPAGRDGPDIRPDIYYFML